MKILKAKLVLLMMPNSDAAKVTIHYQQNIVNHILIILQQPKKHLSVTCK